MRRDVAQLLCLTTMLTLVGCSSKGGGGGGGDPGGGSTVTGSGQQGAGAGTSTDDEENEPAGQPQMVAGAFLTGVGPAKGSPGAPGHALALGDDEVFGGGLFAAGTKKKYQGELTDVYVDLIDADFNVSHPTLIEAPADSPWHVYFVLPSGSVQQYKAMVFVAKYAASTGQQLPVETSTTDDFAFTPAPLTEAEVAASKPVVVDPAPPTDDGLADKIATVLQTAAASNTAPPPVLIISPIGGSITAATVKPILPGAPTLTSTFVATATLSGTATLPGTTTMTSSGTGLGTTTTTSTATLTTTTTSTSTTTMTSTTTTTMTSTSTTTMTSTGTGVGTMSPTGTTTSTTTSTGTGVGTMSPTGTTTSTTTSTGTGVGTMSPTGTTTSTTTSTGTGVGTMSPTGTTTSTATVVMISTSTATVASTEVGPAAQPGVVWALGRSTALPPRRLRAEAAPPYPRRRSASTRSVSVTNSSRRVDTVTMSRG